MNLPDLHRYGSWIGFAAGLLLPLAYAPFDIYWLAPALLAVLIVLWDAATPRRAARLGFLFGLGAFLTGTHWLYVSLHVFGKAPLLLALLLMAALMAFLASYTALLGYATVRLFPRAGIARWLLVLPAGWVLTEWLRGWVLTGFPWLALGYSATDSPLAGWIPFGGVLAASLAVMLSAGALRALFSGTVRARVSGIVVISIVWIAGGLLTSVQWTQPSQPTVTVSIVQGAIPQDRKWLPEELVPTMRLYRDLTEQNLASDIVIWPEAAIPALRSSLSSYFAALQDEGRRSDTVVITGVVEHDSDTGEFHNGVIALDDTVSAYYKRHLVPFGEYFPVPEFVRSWLRMRNLPYSDYTPGAPNQPPLAVAGVNIGVSICYEDLFGNELRNVLPAANMLVNVSNDAWFGTTIAPAQHLQIARVRALEAGRYLLRATNTGISAVIGPDGAVVQTIPQFETRVMTAQVRPHVGLTPYARLGDSAIVALSLAMLAIAALSTRVR